MIGVVRGESASPLPAAWSVLIRQHDSNDGLDVIPGGADRFEAHQRRRALTVVVADVDAEAHLRPVAAAADRTGEQPKHVPKSARLVLAHDTGRNGIPSPFWNCLTVTVERP